MRYYATRPLRVGDGMRGPGEEVPEAGDWKNLRTYLQKGYIAAVPDEVRQPPPAPRGKKVATRTDKSASTDAEVSDESQESSDTSLDGDTSVIAEGAGVLPAPSAE